MVLGDNEFAPDFPTREHIIPKMLGGLRYIDGMCHATEVKNYALSCRGCNSRRGHDLFQQPVIPLTRRQRRALTLARERWRFENGDDRNIQARRGRKRNRNKQRREQRRREKCF